MLKRNLFFLFTLTIFAVASLILDIFNYNPFETETAIFANFYLSLFVSLTGFLAILIYYLKFRYHKNEVVYTLFWPSVRQAAIISLGLSVLLLLKGSSLIDWWIGGSVMSVIVLLELFFRTKRLKSTKIA